MEEKLLGARDDGSVDMIVEGFVDRQVPTVSETCFLSNSVDDGAYFRGYLEGTPARYRRIVGQLENPVREVNVPVLSGKAWTGLAQCEINLTHDSVVAKGAKSRDARDGKSGTRSHTAISVLTLGDFNPKLQPSQQTYCRL